MRSEVWVSKAVSSSSRIELAPRVEEKETDRNALDAPAGLVFGDVQPASGSLFSKQRLTIVRNSSPL